MFYDGDESKMPVDIVEDGDCGEGELHCPKCGGYNTHVQEAWTRPSGDENWVIKGTQAKEQPSKWRRPALVVRISCEFGCNFLMVMQQHKGTTFVWNELLADTANEETPLAESA